MEIFDLLLSVVLFETVLIVVLALAIAYIRKPKAPVYTIDTGANQTVAATIDERPRLLPTTAAVPRARSRSTKSKFPYYVVFEVPENVLLPIGILRVPWESIEALLPNKQYPGSGVRLKGAHDLEEAFLLWKEFNHRIKI
jgi:hypothetical protein